MYDAGFQFFRSLFTPANLFCQYRYTTGTSSWIRTAISWYSALRLARSKVSSALRLSRVSTGSLSQVVFAPRGGMKLPLHSPSLSGSGPFVAMVNSESNLPVYTGPSRENSKLGG